MKKDKIISFCVAFGLGAVIWALSPLVTGEIEPWDADSQYYIVSLLVSGAIVGGLIPKNLWTVFLGVVIGQLIYILIFLPSGPLLSLGIIILGGYALFSLIAAIFAARLRRGTGTAISEGNRGT